MITVQLTSPRVEAIEMDDIYQGQDLFTRARLVNEDGTLPVQADFGTVALNLYRISETGTQDTAIFTEAPAIATVLFDTLQTDAAWTLDDTGYNFNTTIAGANIDELGGGRFKYECILTPTSGSTHVVAREFTVKDILTV